MPQMQARRSFRIDGNRKLKPGEHYDCTEAVARHHEAMGYAARLAPAPRVAAAFTAAAPRLAGTVEPVTDAA